MNEHTEGPWNVVAGDDEDVYDITPADCIGGVVAVAYDAGNAKLIAAAPELLEALRAVAENTTSLEMRSQVYAAIDKATK